MRLALFFSMCSLALASAGCSAAASEDAGTFDAAQPDAALEDGAGRDSTASADGRAPDAAALPDAVFPLDATVDAALLDDAETARDAGAHDAGAPDDLGAEDLGAGSLDVGPPDVGALDAGPADSGPLDSGPTEAGPPDTGPPDTGPPDTGPRDAGPPDLGARDAGPPDLGGRDAGLTPTRCVSGAPGSLAVRFRWRGNGAGSTATVDYEANDLPDTTPWRVSAASSSFGYTPVYDDVFLGPGGLDLGGTVFIDLELSTIGLTSLRGVTIAIYGRSFATTTSGSFTWQTFRGTGASPSGSIANSTPYAWYRADATAAFTTGDGAVRVRLRAGPPSGRLVVNRVELCFDAQ